jgi:hypothetical protein
MLDYNLFLLFKMDFAKETEYRQIKAFRLKYISWPGRMVSWEAGVGITFFSECAARNFTL